MTNSSAQAFIAFLRCEAQQAEDRARSLRATAAAIEANSVEPRRKKRRREAPNRPRAQSAFNFFVHENYELMKKEHADLTPREIMSMLTGQWGSTSEEEKQLWKYRAEQARNEPFPTIPMPEVPTMDDEEEDEEDLEEVDADDELDSKRQESKRGAPVITV